MPSSKEGGPATCYSFVRGPSSKKTVSAVPLQFELTDSKRLPKVVASSKGKSVKKPSAAKAPKRPTVKKTSEKVKKSSLSKKTSDKSKKIPPKAILSVKSTAAVKKGKK